MIIMSDASRCASCIVVTTGSGAVVTVSVLRVQFRSLRLEALGLGSLSLGFRHPRFSIPLSFCSSNFCLGPFTASGRLPLVRGGLVGLGLSGEPLRFSAVSIGLNLFALVRLASQSREEHN
jgi:hypothetical protein